METIILQWLSYGFKNLCFDRKEGVAAELRMTILQPNYDFRVANFLSVSWETSQFQHHEW